MSDDESGLRKNRNHEEPENHERWLVSYADFITLLFAFFVVMYATSNNNQEKQKEFQKSVNTSFKIVGGAGSGDGGTAGAEGNVGGNDTGENFITLDGFPSRGGPVEAQQYIGRLMDKSMDSGDKEKIQEMRHDAVGVRIELASSQFFLPGGVKLKINALKTLDKIAEILKQTDKKVVIEGHTDNTPVGKDAPFESNWELSSLRATSIVKYLIKYHQIAPSRLSAMSYADTRPLESNNSEQGRARNRRIEIYLILDEKLQN